MKRDVVELCEEDERENETIIMNNDGNDNLTTNSESGGSVNNVKWDL